MNDLIMRILLNAKAEEEKNRQIFGKEYIENDYVFKWPNGKMYAPDYVSKWFNNLLKKNGLPHIRFHDLRHTCASLLINQGYQLKDVSEWLGHEDISTTSNFYGHLEIARKKLLAEAMSNIVSE